MTKQSMHVHRAGSQESGTRRRELADHFTGRKITRSKREASHDSGRVNLNLYSCARPDQFDRNRLWPDRPLWLVERQAAVGLDTSVPSQHGPHQRDRIPVPGRAPVALAQGRHTSPSSFSRLRSRHCIYFILPGNGAPSTSSARSWLSTSIALSQSCSHF